MTTQTLTISEFLLARLSEDEAEALAAGGRVWRWDHGYGDMCNDPECKYGQLVGTAEGEPDALLMDVHGFDAHDGWEGGPHIARWDPARVLAECAAKRVVMVEHADDGNDCCWQCEHGYRFPCRTLRALASVYRDHPQYDERWAL